MFAQQVHVLPHVHGQAVPRAKAGGDSCRPRRMPGYLRSLCAARFLRGRRCAGRENRAPLGTLTLCEEKLPLCGAHYLLRDGEGCAEKVGGRAGSASESRTRNDLPRRGVGGR